MKTRLQECLLSPSPRAGTTRHNNSHPCRSPCGAFHWEEHLFTKIIPTCWGLDLLIDSLCMHLLCFLIYFLRWVCWTQTNAKGLGWPLPAIRVCLLVRSLPAKAQGRAPHQLRSSSAGPLLDVRTPLWNWGWDNIHSKGVYEAINFFCGRCQIKAEAFRKPQEYSKAMNIIPPIQQEKQKIQQTIKWRGKSCFSCLRRVWKFSAAAAATNTIKDFSLMSVWGQSLGEWRLKGI